MVWQPVTVTHTLGIKCGELGYQRCDSKLEVSEAWSPSYPNAHTILMQRMLQKSLALKSGFVLMSPFDIACVFLLLLFIFFIIFAIFYAKYGGK